MLMLPGKFRARAAALSPPARPIPERHQGLIERADRFRRANWCAIAPPSRCTRIFAPGSRIGPPPPSRAATTTHVDDPHDWKIPSAPTLVAPGSLRIWDRTTTLENYQMEFQGQIEKRSMSWAFRATNAANYYGAKIVITKPGPQPNAGLSALTPC